MPQLIPTPWFTTLFLSWTILLLIFKTKVLFFSTLNMPITPSPTTPNTNSWNWPWI